MLQTRQRNGILRRCAKGHRNVQNAARAAEKNAPIQTNNNAILSPFANIRLL